MLICGGVAFPSINGASFESVFAWSQFSLRKLSKLAFAIFSLTSWRSARVTKPFLAHRSCRSIGYGSARGADFKEPDLGTAMMWRRLLGVCYRRRVCASGIWSVVSLPMLFVVVCLYLQPSFGAEELSLLDPWADLWGRLPGGPVIDLDAVREDHADRFAQGKQKCLSAFRHSDFIFAVLEKNWG